MRAKVSFIISTLIGLALISCSKGGLSYTNVSHNNGDSLVPSISVDSKGTAHLAWVDLTPGRYTVLYSSKAEGGSWSESIDVSRSKDYATVPSLITDNEDTLHLAWYGYTTDNPAGNNEDIFYASKATAGDWSEPVNISNNSGNSENPSLVVDSEGTIHAVWQDFTPGNNDILYATKSKDGNWSEPVNISNSSGNTENPSLVVDSEGTLHAVWQDSTSGNEDIFYTTKPKDGSWTLPINISDNPGNSQRPTIALDSQRNPHVVWHDNSVGNWEIFYTTRAKDGSWAEATNISKTSGNSGFPSFALSKQDTLYLVWNDDTPGNYDIFYVNKTRGGSWSAAKNISANQGNSANPVLAIDGKGEIHLAWTDYTPGNWDIFYTLLP